MDEAACRARTEQRFEGIDKRQDSQAADIQRLYTAVANVNRTVNIGVGLMIAVNILLGLWDKIIH